MNETVTTADDRQSWFCTTRWTLILEARQAGTSIAQEALEHLCKIYWPPLYAYIRRRGYQPADAQDLTQAFFCFFLANDLVGVADRHRGRFRTFLLTSLGHFLHNHQAAAHALKRGGNQFAIPLEHLEAEEQFQLAAAAGAESPETTFDRRWAAQTMARARTNLRCLYEQEGKLPLFTRLEAWLASEAGTSQYLAAALDLEMTPGAVRTALHRLRHRYGEMIRREIARTVETPEEFESEYAYLRELLAHAEPA